MRTFSLGSGPARKVVKLVVEGNRVGVIEGTPDGGTRRSDKELPSEVKARAACDKMARELIARGFLEEAAAPAAPGAPKSVLDLFEEDEIAPVAPPLPRVAPTVAAEEEKPKKKGGKKKKKKKAATEAGDGLDRRVVAGFAAFGVGLVALIGYVVFDTFFATPTFVGHWSGSNLEYAVVGSPELSRFDLTLDARMRTVLTVQERTTSRGTYTLNRDLLRLKLQGEAGTPFEMEYRVKLGRSTMDLFDPISGKKLVELRRAAGTPPPVASARPSAPKDVAARPPGKADRGAGARPPAPRPTAN